MHSDTEPHSNPQWWEVTVECPINLEDSVYWAFDELDSKGTASQTKDDCRIVTAYFPQAQFQPADFEQWQANLQAAIAPQISQLQLLQVSWRLIAEEDWASSWKDHWQAEEIGDRLVINPAWMDQPTTERTILTLDPGSAFGTGAHATTQLCLKALEKQPLNGATIADIGCGSGILAIASCLYGAHQAFATDVDPLAVQATRANANLNAIHPKTLQVQLGSVGEAIALAQQANQCPVDGIVCNILAEIIVALIIPRLNELANAQTWGILSGILTSKAPWVEENLNAYGWQIAEMTYQDEWCAMIIRYVP
ncbi:MAG: 50S ribosomal protein L11 methyltransferase [Phormidesmis sp. RL_2_1]|nr:50S ribosomal protein L11 methyltransferase [Phormidesmis sp. RL_2_1]